MVDTKLFVSNNNQVICLPEPVAFPVAVERVEVIALGKSRLLTPVDARWDDFFDGATVSPDFMSDRGSEPPTE